MAANTSNEIPVKVYKSERRITVAAPMPGLEPQDIKISLSGDGNLTLTGELRGTLKGENEIIMDEWNPGAYSRSLSISEAVDASSADASYENGVLVVSLPMSSSFQSGEVKLERVGPTEGRTNG